MKTTATVQSTAGRLYCLLLLSILFSCAPEPTAPAKTSLAGKWASNANIFGLSNIQMTLVQEPGGIVSGGWTARAIAPTAGCLTSAPCDVFGSVIGQNLVAHVQLELLLRVAKFEGVLDDPRKLRGALSLFPAGTDTITFVKTSN